MPVIPSGLWFFVALMIAMILWRIYGRRIVALFDRAEQSRAEAERQLFADATNPGAHFRRTLDAINERVEPVRLVRLAASTTLAPEWRGQRFDTVEAAEDARWTSVISEARSFYQGLDEEFGLRVAGPAPRTARKD